MTDDLIIFNNFSNDPDIQICLDYLKKPKSEKEFVKNMFVLAEKYQLHNQVFQSLLTRLLAYHENAFTLSLEKQKSVDPLLKDLVMEDMALLFKMYHHDFSHLSSKYKQLFYDFPIITTPTNKEVFELLSELQENLLKSKSVEEFYTILYNHYKRYGVGMYGLNKAFRYLEGSLVPITHIGNEKFDDLIGYQIQKEQLIKNTEAFIQDKKANNVLLYGDSGTGKSSSIKALLNMFYKDGLRIVEVHKHQFKDLPLIMNTLQDRNYKFIIFMDDLSFEEFEVEYKFLKAVIEGGIEKKPNNILIYATSNRRHLIKETWKDRQFEDEINSNDAKQEKLSLVSRFGLKILYTEPNKQNYLDIIDGLKESYGLDIETAELHRLALQWEIRNGGFSGRTAKQFIYHLLGKKDERFND